MTKVAIHEIGASMNSIIGMNFSTIDSHKSHLSDTWVIDSTTTSHISCHSSLFHSYTSLIHKRVTLPNGHQISVLAIVSFILIDVLISHDILHITSFIVNLWFVEKLLLNPYF